MTNKLHTDPELENLIQKLNVMARAAEDLKAGVASSRLGEEFNQRFADLPPPGQPIGGEPLSSFASDKVRALLVCLYQGESFFGGDLFDYLSL